MLEVLTGFVLLEHLAGMTFVPPPDLPVTIARLTPFASLFGRKMDG
jgi:hypothetical protein